MGARETVPVELEPCGSDALAAIPDPPAPTALVRLALERGADPGTLERLMALAERWEAQQAQRALVEALAEFKGRCPSVIRRDSEVKFGNTHYKHASLGELLSTVTPHLSAASLTLTFEAEQDERGALTVAAILEHVRGGRRRVSLRCPPDASGQKNPIQQIASAATYIKRHAAALILGLSETDDDDGQATAPRPEERPASKTAPAPKPGNGTRAPAPTAEAPAPVIHPAPLALRRLADLRDIAAGIPRARQIAKACDAALMDHERGALSTGQAGALIARAKVALTELGWTEPEEWQAAASLRRATARAEKRAAAEPEEPPLQEPPDDPFEGLCSAPREREPGEEG